MADETQQAPQTFARGWEGYRDELLEGVPELQDRGGFVVDPSTMMFLLEASFYAGAAIYIEMVEAIGAAFDACEISQFDRTRAFINLRAQVTERMVEIVQQERARVKR